MMTTTTTKNRPLRSSLRTTFVSRIMQQANERGDKNHRTDFQMLSMEMMMLTKSHGWHGEEGKETTHQHTRGRVL